MATFVLVHGAGGGGWIWQPVRSLLRAEGHEVYTPTLTGLGERAHLLSPEIDLDTHIQDVVNVLEYEQLSQVILVGHSYGGVVITAVAERIPERLAHLVYLDAYVLENGEGLLDLYDAAFVDALSERVQTQGDGWRLPPDEPPDPRLTDHPFKTATQPIEVKSPAAAALPHTYLLCTDKAEMGRGAQGFIRSAARAQAKGWQYFELGTGHAPMYTMPQELVGLLHGLA